MARPVLYGNRESGHTYKVKLAMNMLEIPYEYREVDLEEPHHRRPPDFREASRFGEVPVLIDEDGPLSQSNAILARLVRGTSRLGGQLDPAQLLEWLFWEANRIGFSVPNLRAVLTYAQQTSPQVEQWLRARALEDLSRLDRELESKPFLLGEDATVADLACCAYLYWPEQAALDLAEWPHLLAWLDRIRALPGWAAPYEI